MSRRKLNSDYTTLKLRIKYGVLEVYWDISSMEEPL
jgi:hypothetical protein